MKEFAFGVYALWFAGLALEMVACWALVKKGYWTHWKAFGFYLFYMLTQNLTLFVVSLLGSSKAYAIAYAAADFIEVLLLSLVVLEILVKVLEPVDVIPGRTVARAAFWAVLGISVAVALSVFSPGRRTNALVDLPLTIEQTIFLADSILLWILLFQAKALGITWKSSVAEIAIGFVLYLTVQATTRFVTGIYTSAQVGNVASGVGQLAYLIALGSWIWTIANRAPALTRPSAETVARMRELSSDHDAVSKERIFAAVGIKMNRPEDDSEEDNEMFHSDDEEPQAQPRRYSLK
jgi:hypothetical protein